MANLWRQKEWLHTYDRWKLVEHKYYDFYIGVDEHPSLLNDDEINDCTSVNINTNLESIDENLTTHSTVQWNDATNTGIESQNWGLTSLDNGYTKIDWKDDDLMDVFTKTTLTIPEEDKMFYLKPVKGNYYCTPPIDYSLEYIKDENVKYLQFKGGFLQGFYKLFLPSYTQEKYQTVFNRAHQVETYEFVIKPSCEQIEIENALNYYYPENAGIFFFKGLRAENKWWYYTRKLNVKNLEDLKNELIENGACSPIIDYLDEEELSKAKSIFETIQTSDNVLLNTANYTETISDNKYLFFNRTCCGFTIFDDYPEKVIVGYQEKNPNLNYYLLFNRTRHPKRGLLVKDLDKLAGCCTTSYWELYKKYRCDEYLRYNLVEKPMQNFPEGFEDIDFYDNVIDIYKDTYNNAMAFKINSDGSIGYRILLKNDGEDKCENPTKLFEEYSLPNIIKCDCWNHIVVKIEYAQYLKEPECNFSNPRVGVISFYVNGYLKFASKSFVEPIFHELDEHYTKQEGVPYNISLMGGTQGLLETILSDNPEDYDRYVFPLEQNFAGTLMGDLMIANISECNIGFTQIQNRYKMFKTLYPDINWC
jgi:hypothetical protein